MRVMVFGKATEETESGAPPSAEAWAAMDAYIEELAGAGVLVAAAGLKPMSQSKRIVSDGSRRTVLDGPFAESKEVVAGFQIWEVKTMDEAVAWAMRSPDVTAGRSEMDIRPFYEVEDLAEHLSPEDLAAPREGDRGRLGVA